MLRTLRALALLALSVGSSGCNSAPTLPIPPPSVEVGSPNIEGLVRVEGDTEAQAFVFILNQATDEGVITRADDNGHFSALIAASQGDLLTIWAEVSGEEGEHTEREVLPPR